MSNGLSVFLARRYKLINLINLIKLIKLELSVHYLLISALAFSMAASVNWAPESM